MKLTLKAIAGLMLISASMSASAQRFAYVDSEYILAQMPSYRSAQSQLDELSKEWQSEIDEKFDEIDRLYKEYQVNKVLMSKDKQLQRENEIIEKEREAKKLQNEKFGYEGELFQKRAELIKPIQDKVYAAINKVAKENGLDFIFDKSGDMLMLVSNPKFDRSGEVLEELGVVSTDGGDGGNNLPPGFDDDDSEDENLPPR